MIGGEVRADGCIIGQFDDPVVILAQLQLAHRTHHAVGFDAADRALAKHHAVGGYGRAGQPQHALHPRAGIGRAADNLQRIAIARVNGEHLQLVRIGMTCSGEHMGNAEARELFGRILDTLDLQPDGIERIEDFRKGRLGIEVVLEPGQGELHARAPTPAESVG